jgi:RNA polymerase sigma factor (sigma-70 family)
MMDAPAAWADLLAAHRVDLLRIARVRLRGLADAEDVVQEVTLRVLRAGRPATAVAAPAAYLRRAVVNECTSHWRRSSRDVLTDTVPDRPTDDTVDACLDRMLLHGALAGLTERQRRIITLSLLDDRADADIAAALGISEVTVRTTRLRGLARLRLLLAGALPDRHPTGATCPAPRRGGLPTAA